MKAGLPLSAHPPWDEPWAQAPPCLRVPCHCHTQVSTQTPAGQRLRRPLAGLPSDHVVSPRDPGGVSLVTEQPHAHPAIFPGPCFTAGSPPPFLQHTGTRRANCFDAMLVADKIGLGKGEKWRNGEDACLAVRLHLNPVRRLSWL